MICAIPISDGAVIVGLWVWLLERCIDGSGSKLCARIVAYVMVVLGAVVCSELSCCVYGAAVMSLVVLVTWYWCCRSYGGASSFYWVLLSACWYGTGLGSTVVCMLYCCSAGIGTCVLSYLLRARN